MSGFDISIHNITLNLYGLFHCHSLWITLCTTKEQPKPLWITFRCFQKASFFSTFIHNLFTPCSKRYPDLYPHAIALFFKEIFYLLTEFSTTYLRLFLHKYFYFFGTKEKRTLAYSPLVIQIPNLLSFLDFKTKNPLFSMDCRFLRFGKREDF